LRSEDGRGFALVLVLWIAALLGIIAASLVSSGRTEIRLASNLVQNAKAEALADGAVQRAVVGLLAADPREAWRAGGGPYQLTYGEGEVRASISDEDGKVDINAAPPELLAGLLAQAGLNADAAHGMANRIVDYRDRDHERRPQGAEDPEHVTVGRPAGAMNRKFATESELLGVPGMTPELYRRIRPFITVFSGTEAVDPMHASRVVLAAIPGMTDQLVEAFAKAGAMEDPLASIDDTAVVDVEPYLIPSREVMYEVCAQATTAGGGIFVREAVIELTGQPLRPFLVHAWRHGTLDGCATGASGARD
jgi:general secretion pathway protein K